LRFRPAFDNLLWCLTDKEHEWQNKGSCHGVRTPTIFQEECVRDTKDPTVYFLVFRYEVDHLQNFAESLSLSTRQAHPACKQLCVKLTNHQCAVRKLGMVVCAGKLKNLRISEHILLAQEVAAQGLRVQVLRTGMTRTFLECFLL